MTLVVIADDDDQVGHLDCTPFDVLISCGDLHDNTLQRAVERYRPSHTLAVRGNHDMNTPIPEGIVDLHLQVLECGGLRFGGFGGSWRYKPRGHHLFEQDEVLRLMRAFPAVDVFIAHNSPVGIHERDRSVHWGFEGFVEYLDRVQPRLFLHGHQHLDRITLRGNTTIIGVYGERVIDVEPLFC